jgi:hypothetical protein
VRTRHLALLIASLYFLALVTPTVENPTIQLWGPRRLPPPPSKDTAAPGFVALWFSLHAGLGALGAGSWMRALRGGLILCSAVSNVVLLAGLARLGAPEVRTARNPARLEGILWGAALLNTHWLLYTGQDYPTRADLRSGYFLWLACFLLTAIGLNAMGRVQSRLTSAALAG